jgi:hypothetical protein
MSLSDKSIDSWSSRCVQLSLLARDNSMITRRYEGS